MDGYSGTLTLRYSDTASRPANGTAQLFLVVQAGPQREPPLRLRIDDLDRIDVSRGANRRIAIAADGERRRGRLDVADRWMSVDHAALVRCGQGWKLVDGGSKNGTRVNGVPQREAMLGNGDLLELGHTFFVLRTDLPDVTGSPRALDAGELETLPGMATLRPDLAERFDELARLAASKASIVLRGPTGSGKELLARAVHAMSGRRGAFVAVNCAGLPEALAESELFGHVRGAFSGAARHHTGLIAASCGGTLFLDEIGELPRSTQSKLLRALQEQAVRRVGDNAEQPVDLRVVAATHRDLGRLVAADQFRDDLLGRLGGVFELPSLAGRREDLGLILEAVLGRIEDPRARAAHMTSDAVRALIRHPWPRNIRQLQKCLEQAIALAGGGPIAVAHLPPELWGAPSAPEMPAARALSPEDCVQRARLIELLRLHRGNIAAVARELQTVRSTIQRWMVRYGVERGA